MALARLHLLPASHPGARLLSLVWDLPCPGWPAAIRLCMRQLARSPIMDILAHPGFSECEVAEARSDTETRRKLLHRYRNTVVLPSLIERDQAAYLKTAGGTLPDSVTLIYSVTLTYYITAGEQSLQLLDMSILDLGPHTWKLCRAWATRLTGCWPTTCYGSPAMLLSLTICPLCKSHSVMVTHSLYSLCECPGTLALYTSLCSEVVICTRY